MKLTKAIIARYGITKKAWQVARASKSTTKTKRRYSTMAKRKSYSKKASSMLSSPVAKSFMGAAGVMLYEAFLSPKIPLEGTAKDVLELVGGLYLSKKSGFLGATGKTLVTINAYQLLSKVAGGYLTGVQSSNQIAPEYNY